jgi:hypothetical protein
VKIVICYIVISNGPKTDDFCSRFVATYREFPPGIEHETMLICQGGPPPTETALIFEGIWPLGVWPHLNDPGWDVSAYIDAANGPCKEADIMVCMGESVHFHRAGWLKRFVEAWAAHGPGFYGPFASNLVRAHLQTTCFCTSPVILRQYPVKVQNRIERMNFEHGERACWRRVSALGMPVRLVTFDGEYEPMAWRYPQNIIYRGTQENCLCWCNHTQGFAEGDATRKRNWSAAADRPFK